MEANLQWKLFMMFATINIGGMALFSLFLPETKGRSLEEVRTRTTLRLYPAIAKAFFFLFFSFL